MMTPPDLSAAEKRALILVDTSPLYRCPNGYRHRSGQKISLMVYRKLLGKELVQFCTINGHSALVLTRDGRLAAARLVASKNTSARNICIAAAANPNPQ